MRPQSAKARSLSQPSLARRFFEYQYERFPVAVLLFTTLSVVLSSFVIALPPSEHLFSHILAISIGTLTGLLFLFSMRVADDRKDNAFDNSYHMDRPVQRGLISLRELDWMNRGGVFAQLLFNVFFSITATLWLLVAFAYSFVASKDFFLGASIRKQFYIYNVLNLIQLLFLQIYLYALINPRFSWSDPLLAIHFVFVLLNAANLEVARKMKRKTEESKGKDTYSARLGIPKAAAFYGLLCVIVYALFAYLLFHLSPQTFSFTLLSFAPLSSLLLLFLLSLLSLGIVFVGTLLYVFWNNRYTPKILEGTAILFYLAMHLLLVGVRL